MASREGRRLVKARRSRWSEEEEGREERDLIRERFDRKNSRERKKSQVGSRKYCDRGEYQGAGRKRRACCPTKNVGGGGHQTYATTFRRRFLATLSFSAVINIHTHYHYLPLPSPSSSSGYRCVVVEASWARI